MIQKSIVVALVLFVVLFPSTSGSSVSAAWLIDRSGTLIEVDGSILGENDGEMLLEREQKTLEIKREAAKKALERATEERQKNMENRNELRQSVIENKAKKLNIRQELMDKDGKVLRTTETALEEEEPILIEREDGQIAEVDVTEEDGLEIRGEKVRTRTHFPLTIGENNALIVTKKDGTQKIVTYLPDAAVARLEEKGFTMTNAEIDLEESEGGTPVYKFQAQEEKKILGIFRRRFDKRVEVSAETGEVVKSESVQTGFAKFLERFAF